MMLTPTDGPYKMVQIPPPITLKTGNEAAEYLQKLCNDEAKQGWLFQRIDLIPGKIPAGCLGGFLGYKPVQVMMSVATFVRKQTD